jgi:lysylphosphatidylglycerol synthetase-like protein (DUF2156 family)
MADPVEGNPCLFALVKMANLCMIAVGVIVAGLGVYATVAAKDFNWYSGTFIIFGVVMFIVAIMGYKNRRHPHWMTLYLLFILCLVICVGGLTIGIICYPDYASKVGGEEHANAIRYALLAVCILTVVCLLLGCWYRSSLNDAIFDFEFQPIERSRPLVTPKSDQARAAMEEKYPKLKELHEKRKAGS